MAITYKCIDPLFDAVNLAICDLERDRSPRVVARQLREAVRVAEASSSASLPLLDQLRASLAMELAAKAAR